MLDSMAPRPSRPTGWIGITLGDAGGIGPEVVLKALASLAHDTPAKFLLLGDPHVVAETQKLTGLDLPITEFQDYSQPGNLFLHNPAPALGAFWREPGHAESARAALTYLREGGRRCLKGELDALVTAPVNKASIIAGAQPFVGQTEFLAEMAENIPVAMMLLGRDERGRWLRVLLTTTHLPLRAVPDAITRQNVDHALAMAASACRQLGLERGAIGVCALNPHAGEAGNLGHEEIDILKPAVRAAQAKGLNITGPLAADTLFHQALHGQFDVVVAMYHDQGLAPLKMIAFHNGVNWTVGLPFPRTSPDHGTAYNLARKNLANSSSMLAALNLALHLSANSS